MQEIKKINPTGRCRYKLNLKTFSGSDPSIVFPPKTGYIYAMTKPLILFLIAASCAVSAFSQQKYFEGSIVYHVSVQSKVDNLNEDDFRKVMAEGEVMTVICKNGNFRRTSKYGDEITHFRDKKTYIKFPRLDTLYYLDFPPDTAAGVTVLKTDSIFKVNNFDCKAITLRTPTSSSRYYYTASLLNDPSLAKDYTLGNYNVYARETGGSVYLWLRTEYSIGTTTDSCVSITEKAIDDHTFDLPALPLKKIDFASMQSGPRFPGKEGAWQKYLQANLNSQLGIKYIKLAKDQQSASVTVNVEFVVAKDGSISDIQVLNKKEVHPKLAGEAVRVVQDSPRWLPAQAYGQPINGSVRQSITFSVER